MIGAILGDIIGSPYEFDGGDCDTLTAIAGSIAEGFYGVPTELKEECYKRLPEPLLKVLKAFEEHLE